MLTTVITHATGDVFPATDWNTYVRDNVNWDIQYGGSIASANTLSPTNRFSIVTGTTALKNLTVTSPVAGQRVQLLFQGALTIQHNAGGTGNLRVVGGDWTVDANTLVTFIYDGTNWWVFPPSGRQIDYAQITANSAAVSATTEATAIAIITGNSVNYDGSKVKLEFWASSVNCTATINAYAVLFRDGTALGQSRLTLQSFGQGALAVEFFDTPPAGAHTYSIKMYVSGSSATIEAGLGGSGNFLPAFLRVTKA